MRGLPVVRAGGGPPPAIPTELDAGIVDATRPLGVYIHFPYCTIRCPYCDFAVEVVEEIPHRVYADAILRELAARAGGFRAAGRIPALRSIYFGGGTPGLWRGAELARVAAEIRQTFAGREAAIEITVEANPGEVTEAALAGWRRAGVNRLSLGVQAFDDDLLRSLGRNHDGRAGAVAVARARAAGFDNVSCDLMFGLPGQSAGDWRTAVERLIQLDPAHVSAYGLTVEPGTEFANRDRAGRLERPDDDAAAAMYVAGRAALRAAGYAQYEVSSHARPGRRSVHNQLYWTGGAYLGLGVGAASFRPLADGTALRWRNPRSTATYLRGWTEGAIGRPAQVEVLDAGACERDAVWLALRTADGIDRRAHAARFVRDPLAIGARADAAAALARRGWLEVTETAVRPTEEGLLFADELAARLL